ncbi:hypothetical protein ACFQJD_08650 [Haloplanus sp. GCM10025708]
MAQLLEPTPTSELTACPTCGHGIVNVQGIHACGSCGWVEPQYR